MYQKLLCISMTPQLWPPGSKCCTERAQNVIVTSNCAHLQKSRTHMCIPLANHHLRKAIQTSWYGSSPGYIRSALWKAGKLDNGERYAVSADITSGITVNITSSAGPKPQDFCWFVSVLTSRGAGCLNIHFIHPTLPSLG